MSFTMRPEETLYLQQIRRLGQALRDSVGIKTTKANIILMEYFLLSFYSLYMVHDIFRHFIMIVNIKENFYEGCDVWRSGDMG